MLPQLAKGEANKIFVIPSEFTQALGNLGASISGRPAPPAPPPASPPPASAPPPQIPPGS
jgi:hypothetical protein